MSRMFKKYGLVGYPIIAEKMVEGLSKGLVEQ